VRLDDIPHVEQVQLRVSDELYHHNAGVDDRRADDGT